jgi:type I restriction enzyme, S subunit
MSEPFRRTWEFAGGTLVDDCEVVPLESLLMTPKSIAVGVMYPGEHTVGGVPLIKVGDIKDGCVSRPSFCISAVTNQEHIRTQLVGDELLITLVGNPGECVLATPEMAGWNPARAIAVVRLKDDTLRSYVKAILESAPGRHLIDSVLNTTVQKTLNLKDIRQLPIPMPGAAVIGEITEFATLMSTRIGLLRETNETLEVIAQALFKSWFVDFDPVRAKSEGRQPEGMDETTAALFPNTFDASPLGQIPSGWHVGLRAELLALHKSTIDPRRFPDTEFNLFSLPAFDKGEVPVRQFGRDIKSNKTKVPLGAVLLSKLNPHIPRVWLPSIVEDNSICSTEFLPFVPTSGSTPELVYCLLRTNGMMGSLSQLVTGTSNSHQRVRPEGVLTQACVVPPGEIVLAFSELIGPTIERIKADRLQGQTLTQLRDSLLPRLISGQLRVSVDGVDP